MYRLLGGRYPSLIAPTDSCVNPAISPHLRLYPRERSLCRLLSAPAADGTFSTLFCESFLRCLSPYPGGPTECTCLVLPRRHRPSPGVARVGFPLLPANTIFHGRDFEAAAIPLCSGLQVCLPPGSFLPLQVFPCRAAEAFMSEQNVRRYLRTHRIG